MLNTCTCNFSTHVHVLINYVPESIFVYMYVYACCVCTYVCCVVLTVFVFLFGSNYHSLGLLCVVKTECTLLWSNLVTRTGMG